MTTTVTTIVEIAAPPDFVRSLFLDFPSMSQWHTDHFSSITILESASVNSNTTLSVPKSAGENLQVGDKLRIALRGGMSFKATVLENTAQRFVWRGGWSHVMTGEHMFQFDASSSMPGGTTLTHGETFAGGLVTLCRPFMKSDKDQKSPGFEKFNVDLKKRAEQKR